jgi:tetratricopeptide (TPR) repeat protein
LEPNNLYALSYLGKQQFGERRFGEAQQTWEKILHHDASWAEAYFYLGAVQAEQGHAEAAVSAYQRALALVIASHGGMAEAQTSDAESASSTPLAVVVPSWEKVLAQGTGYEQARASFQEARQILAQRYVEQGQECLRHEAAKEAISHLHWVSVLTPEDDAARALLKQAQTSLTFEQGIRHYQAQDYVQALRCFRDTLALDPEHEKAKRYLRYAQQCLEGGVSERFRHLDLGDREKS